ncbi:hypothetical protein CONPUDRAFT_135444 [Coniophora puteana RWD-64-598 SS2]|uniref:Lytic polysaccharide monooxygenase n=1 Tax=Coniophora puteana (strain RWD-64-598) TaxID=741705 RepID=A0A5M3MX04_CONPW|nr:uncharacterized protein CONPUDRAFT_135444 [Coniophora puteana RWD-64-598 SS2]EIW83669.1 hypothetical protein CONPUDRAFT_135444 [Coniophora puteana RWD-64-598 SS2]
MLGTLTILFLALQLRLVAGHASIWHPSMWGFNVTESTFHYDNRPVSPLQHYSFDQWWFHGHLDYPPHPQDVFELPAGQNVTTEITCDKAATSFHDTNAPDSGKSIIDPNDPDNVCPGQPISEFHTKGLDDVKGCALAIAYKSNVSDVAMEDFTVFSVNQTCVWTRFTDFSVPKDMPPCPDGKCICAFFWIHSPDSGGEQNYMNGFQCNVTNSVSNVPVAQSQVARRCGADPLLGKVDAVAGNCTYGAKQPLYWFQAENNTLFEGAHSPPFYNDLYNFKDGAQNDIFQGFYESIPVPSAFQTKLPILAVPSSSSGSGSGSGSGSSSAPEPASNSTSSGSAPASSASSLPSPSSSGKKTCRSRNSTSTAAKKRRSNLSIRSSARAALDARAAAPPPSGHGPAARPAGSFMSRVLGTGRQHRQRSSQRFH